MRPNPTQAERDNVIPNPKRVSPGSELSASAYNLIVDNVIRNKTGIDQPKQSKFFRINSTLPEIRQFKVVSEHGDYLKANPYDGAESNTDVEILIAKPYLLRQSLASRNSLTFTYSSNTRTADDGSETEDQVVVPSYVVGDVIYAMRNVQGGTSVNISINGIDKKVVWLDLNIDGRAWAKEAT